jgi:hypothetical protein
MRKVATMKAATLWVRWMLVVAGILIGAGVFLAVAGGTSALGLLNDRIDPTFWGDASVTGPAAEYRAWVFAVLGGTMAGWAIAMFALIRHGIAKGLRWAWNAVALSLLGWFPLDTGYSLAHGVWINAAGNTVILLAMAIPLAMTRRGTD